MHQAIEHKKEVSPRDEFVAPLKSHARFVTGAHEEFVNTHFVGNFFEGLLRVNDGEGDQNRARPGRNLVNIEPEPVGKKDDLRWDRGNCVVVVLPQETEINLGEGVDLGNAAKFKD